MRRNTTVGLDRLVRPKELIAVFVYGTLCVPAVLTRVLGRNCNELTFQDAVLPVGPLDTFSQLS